VSYVHVGFLVASLLAAKSIVAQTAQSPASSGPDENAADVRVQPLRKISVSATRGPQELTDIPNTVTVVSSEEIERELARDIKDLIRYEPGISVGNASTRFGLAGFNIRGIEANRVAMRIDGVRMSDAFSIGSFSDARRNLVDLDMLKSVEIVRGPASALYGSDAIGGIVSFVTKDPSDLLAPGESSYLRVKSDYRDDSDAWNVGSTVAMGGEQLGALLLYRHGEAAETDNQGNIGTRDSSRTAPNPQDGETDSVLGKVTWKPSEAQTLRVTLAYDRDENLTDVFSSQGRGVGALANVFTVSLNGDDTQERTRLALEHTIALSNSAVDDLEWRVYAQETQVEQRTLEERYSVSTGPGSTVFRDRLFSFEQTTLGGEVLARKTLSLGSAEHLVTYGVDLLTTDTEQMRNGRQTTRSTGAVTSNIPPDNFPVRDFPKTTTDQYAVYVQDQITFADGALLLIPGARVDYYKLEPDADDIFTADNPGVTVADLEETSVSPKLGAIWNFTDGLSVYANYARGFRAPPYNDVNIGFTNLAFGYTAIANPDLKPETSNGYEIGLRGESGQAFFSVAGFYNDYDDFIASLNPVGTQGGLQIFQSQNLSEAHIYGAEMRGGMRLFDESVRIRSSVAYARGAGRREGQSGDRPLNSVDPLKAVLGVAYQPGNAWSVELVGTAVDRHHDVDQTTPQFVPAGYFLLDLLAHAEVGEHVQFNAGIFNITDKKYWEWSDVRGQLPTSAVLDRFTPPGINFGASVAVEF
jgi:hemoglobin/transferrin/lactoferrin receptor protein